MKIVLYTDGSNISLDARKFLQERHIQFEEVDIRTQQGFERLLKRTQQNKSPAFELKRSHSVFIVVGLDKGLLERELGLKHSKT